MAYLGPEFLVDFPGVAVRMTGFEGSAPVAFPEQACREGQGEEEHGEADCYSDDEGEVGRGGFVGGGGAVLDGSVDWVWLRGDGGDDVEG